MRAFSRLAAGACCLWLATGLAPLYGETIHIEIAKLAYAPADAAAHVGDTVVWDNEDFVVHTATARDKQWDVTIPAKGTGSLILKNPGSIDYYCRFHPNMKGHITVTAKQGS